MTDTNIPTMQDVIRRFDDYWAAHGCLIWRPYSEKVGAGTMNPATVLRVLGPEPWNVGYLEPSFRADDGRYAENPNRMQMHHQYQVILKPDPGNPQELYLGSLEAIGLDLTKHDVRFVEDNWESPALGAWGLGWEVWLDGQEITQFTYFQQAGSLTLDPVSVEITYGLDRIIMYLQGKRAVWDIQVDETHTYDELYRQPEIEHCVYNFELADVERLKQLYDIYNAEAQACIERELVIPAYDFVLRQSHTFNLLDARGAIGVTERAKFFADMRRQARAISELYVAQREREKFPWLGESAPAGAAEAPVVEGVAEDVTVDEPQDFVLELGSEELPPQDVVDGIAQIQESMKALLDEFKLDYADLRVTGTTRRLVAYVTGLAPRQRDEVVEKRGPKADRAFDAANQPTRAAQGFARGQGVEVSDLEIRGEYVYAVKRVAGKPTLEVLPDLSVRLLDGLRWRKTMRWNASNVGYPTLALDRGPLRRCGRSLRLGQRGQRTEQPGPPLCRRGRASARGRLHHLRDPGEQRLLRGRVLRRRGHRPGGAPPAHRRIGGASDGGCERRHARRPRLAGGGDGPGGSAPGAARSFRGALSGTAHAGADRCHEEAPALLPRLPRGRSLRPGGPVALFRHRGQQQ